MKHKKQNFSSGNPLLNQLNQPKLQIKGVDKLIKDNLKKNKTKEEEEIVKKYLDDYR